MTAAITWEINLGQIITIATVLFAGVGLFFGVKERVALLESQLLEAEKRLRQVEARQIQYFEHYIPILMTLQSKLNEKQEVSK